MEHTSEAQTHSLPCDGGSAPGDGADISGVPIMKEVRPAIDWQEVYTRLERTQRTLEAGGHLPPEEVRRILRERAQALARPLAEAQASVEVLELLVFSLSGERYGIETTHVLEVIPLGDLTRVPCTPPFVLGVVNHRGRILSVLDFRRLFELPGQELNQGGRIVAVEAGGMTFGIFADAVDGLVRLGTEEVAPPLAALTGDRQTFLRGVTAGMVAVVDLESLGRNPGIVVNEEAS